MLTLTKAAGVGQFYALKMPQSGSILWRSVPVESSAMTDPQWSCIANPSRMNKSGHRMNRPGQRLNKPGPLRKKPGLASIMTTRICSDEIRRASLQIATGSFEPRPCESPMHCPDSGQCRLIVEGHRALPLGSPDVTTPNLSDPIAPARRP